MIVVDTNVVSEPLRPRPDPTVVAWLDAQLVETLFLPAVGLAELLVGIEGLPPGKRRQALSAGLGKALAALFEGRVLPFDARAAEAYARLVTRARSAGVGIGTADGQIAAIAASHGFAVATRDRAPYAACGLKVVNPWQTESGSN